MTYLNWADLFEIQFYKVVTKSKKSQLNQ